MPHLKEINNINPDVFSGIVRAILTKIGSVTITEEELLAIAKHPAEILAMDVRVPGQITLSLRQVAGAPEVIQ